MGRPLVSGVVDMAGRVEARIFSIAFPERAPGKDLTNPAMTTYPNPMAVDTAEDSRRLMTEERNLDKLHRDARMRSCPLNGDVYAGIMDTRYKGE